MKLFLFILVLLQSSAAWSTSEDQVKAYWVNTGLQALSKNQLPLAQFSYEKSKKQGAPTVAQRLLQALLLSETGEQGRALKMCEELKLLPEIKGTERWRVLECVADNAFRLNKIELMRETLLAMRVLSEETPDVSGLNLDSGAKAWLLFQLGRSFELGVDGKPNTQGSDLVKAAEMHEHALKTYPGITLALFHLALIEAHEKRYEKAFQFNSQFISLNENHAVGLYNQACFLARLERKGEALSFLQTAVFHGFRDRKHILRDPDLESLRGEAQFLAIVQGLAEIPK